jgi:hypothetical protein
MKLEREVIVDLLPAYFSGEASAATRALVEEYFREHPDFEASARRAGDWLDRLNVPASAPDPEKEKLALERARLVGETRSSLLWMAIFFTAILAFFRVHDHKMIFIFWEDSMRGAVLAAVAAFLWAMYLFTRKRKDPLLPHMKFLAGAIFYSLLPFLFTVKDHKIVLLISKDPNVAVIMGGMAVLSWTAFFYHWLKFRRRSS